MTRVAACVAWIAFSVGWIVGDLHAQAVPESDTHAGAGQEAAAPSTYGARARVSEDHSRPTQPPEAETQALQADLGASFSLAESMPGSLPVFSGVPYLIVRGAAPAGTATYYDTLVIPSLFHVALGPAVINPHLLGKLSFYPGVAPARFGRHVGGSFVADAPLAPETAVVQRDIELTLLDASGYLYAPEIHTAFAWRFGDPGLLMNVLGLNATLNYYDYQVRHESLIAPHTRLVLLALGMADELGDRTAPEDDISLTIHRLLARLTRRFGGTEVGAQLTLGYDASKLGQELTGESARFTPSIFVEHRVGRTRLRVGAEMLATDVALRQRVGNDVPASVFTRTKTLNLDPEDFLNGQPYASLPARGGGGLYAELAFEPFSRMEVQLGLRGDTWLSGSELELALSPSGRVSYALTQDIELHAALGLSHQAHGSPVPLPSLADVSIDRGLEQSVQAELGASFLLPAGLQLEATYFHHRYIDAVYLELILDCPGNSNAEAAQSVLRGADLPSICRDPALPTASGTTQGLELYLKRNLTERISGFISYTLAFADATARDGTNFTPQSDVRHLGNAVLHVDLGAGFALGLRAHYRTGKMAVNTLFDATVRHFERIEQRLPGFFRADLRGSYTWNVSFGRMEASIGVQNITASSEATNRDCVVDQTGILTGRDVPIICTIDYQRAILLPNLGIRAEM